MCRTYQTDHGLEGAPSIEMIRAALRAERPAAADRARVARWNSLVVAAKISARSEAGFVRAEFRNDATVRKELTLLGAAERESCPFLQFDVVETETAVTLTVTLMNADAIEDLHMLAPALGIA